MTQRNWSPTTEIQVDFTGHRGIRRVQDPTAAPCFRSVTRIWHFPNDTVILERAARRDCLLAEIDVVDVPVTGSRRVGSAVALDTDTTVRVVEEGDKCILRDINRVMMLE
jgi:hypothetical protein